MKLMRMSGFIGTILGALVVLPLIIFVYNKYFIKQNNNVEPFLKPYMQNVVEVQFKMPNTSRMPIGEEPYVSEQIETKLIKKNMTGSNSKLSYYYYQDIYSKTHNKHIRIGMFDLSNLFWFDIGDSTVLLKLNKDDFNNPKYGTKEKPLMCFSLRGAHGAILVRGRGTKNEGKMINKDTSPKQYEYNVYMYLTYVMSRTEFKDRFEKKK